LIEVVDGVARLRMQGSCHGCPSSTVTLKQAIEETILKAAPDVLHIEAEGVAEPPPPHAFVPMATLQRRRHADG
jgi:Fe-S cluster biogenesis protein NfuA